MAGVNKPVVEFEVDSEGVVADGVIDCAGFEGSPMMVLDLELASTEEPRPAGAVTLLAIAGAETDVGRSNVTFFLGSDAANVAFLCSSNFFRSFAIASASRSCFSHLEYDFEGVRIGDCPPCLKAS